MKIRRKNCLVTGGAGFIGSHLVDSLLAEGCAVRVIDNLANGKIYNIQDHLSKKCFDFQRGDITDPGDLRLAMQDIDVVFHLACLGVRHSLSHPFANHRVNAEGALFALEAALRTKVGRFIYCSTSEVYGSAETAPMPETHPTRPCTVYGASKLAGEAYARAYFTTYGLKTTIIRPFNTYGPRSHHEGDAGEMIPKAIVRALNDQPILIFGDGNQSRDFTYVEDMVRALIIGAESDDMVGQTVNISSGFEISINDLARKILDLLTVSKSQIKHLPNRPGDVKRLYADCTKFTTLGNWRPAVGFEEGLLQTVQYFKNHSIKPEILMNEEIGRNWGEVNK